MRQRRTPKLENLLDDEELAKRALTDPEAFAALYDRYVDIVYRYCYRKLGNVAAAEDATSTAFLNTLRGMRSFNPETKPFRSWLFGVAHNAVVDQVRLQNRRREEQFETRELIVDRAPPLDQIAISRDESERVRVAISSLPPEQQQVMTLRLAGMSAPEIATALDRKPGAIRATQHRAALKLRRLLAPLGPASPAKGASDHD